MVIEFRLQIGGKHGWLDALLGRNGQGGEQGRGVAGAQERGPDDLPGGDWETRPQQRLVSYDKLIDEATASAVEVWPQESTLGVSRQLLSVAERFTVDEAAALHRRFAVLDDKLQAEDEHFAPGFQARPMRYFFNEISADFTLEDFIGSWN